MLRATLFFSVTHLAYSAT